MKKTLTIIAFACLWLSSMASTWNLHGSRDNYLEVGILGGDYQVSEIWYDVYWDYNWDALHPDNVWSGVRQIVPASFWIVQGYQDSWTIDVPGPSEGFVLWAWISQGAPDYNGGTDMIYPPPDFNQVRLDPGEYWFDFSPFTTAEFQVGRISTVKPADFGKWAWDGSINPSWVEPPLAPVERTKRGKGHNK